MTADAALARLAKAHGIVPRYRDMQKHDRIATPDTLRALLHASGVAADTPSEVRESLAALQQKKRMRHTPEEVIVESGKPARMPFDGVTPWRLCNDESGAEVISGGRGEAIALPALASGVYDLYLGAETVRIIAAPARAPGLEDIVGRSRFWGINLALYGLRSARNGGVGDFTDLADMARVAGRHGAGFLGTNPVHAMGHTGAAVSPYSPTHRGFLNTGHIALDHVPGQKDNTRARDLPDGAAEAMQALRATAHVDYETHKPLHQGLLADLFALFLDEASATAHADLAAFTTSGGPELARFARFETIAEHHGPDWRIWTQDAHATSDPARDTFHIWLQWVADTQLAAVQSTACDNGMALGLYGDLAVGARRDGAESWCEAESIAQGVSVGAPPDHLSPEGQNWDLCAYAPGRLAAQNYRPFRRLLAATMRHAGVIRIDHILGLSRSFWIPDDGSPGGYIRQPLDALLALVKIEAERQGTVVIGEDLGLVPHGFRKTMRDNGLYGYSVVQYERDSAGRLSPNRRGSSQVLSCFSTHDTPTVHGFEVGRDIDWWQKLGWTDEAGAAGARSQRKSDIADLMPAKTDADFTDTVHGQLARSRAAMVTVQLDDILRCAEAQNLPGTTDAHVNWRRKYDIETAKFGSDPRLQTLANQMNPYRGPPRSSRPQEMSDDHQ